MRLWYFSQASSEGSGESAQSRQSHHCLHSMEEDEVSNKKSDI